MEKKRKKKKRTQQFIGPRHQIRVRVFFRKVKGWTSKIFVLSLSLSSASSSQSELVQKIFFNKKRKTFAYCCQLRSGLVCSYTWVCACLCVCVITKPINPAASAITKRWSSGRIWFGTLQNRHKLRKYRLAGWLAGWLGCLVSLFTIQPKVGFDLRVRKSCDELKQSQRWVQSRKKTKKTK